MNDIVVDSSVVAKWILPEPDSDQARSLVRDAASGGKRLIVLDLAFSEVANAIWKRHRQNLITAAEAAAALDVLLRAPVHVEAAARLLGSALEIAIKYDRAIYDALFVALTRDLRLSGVTADGPLVNALRADFPDIVLLRDWRSEPTPPQSPPT